MWVSRYWQMIPVLAIAEASPGSVPPSPPALPTHAVVRTLLVTTVLLVGALTFCRARPRTGVEHLQLHGAH
jgi:K+-transporting ATPase A subunit